MDENILNNNEQLTDEVIEEVTPEEVVETEEIKEEQEQQAEPDNTPHTTWNNNPYATGAVPVGSGNGMGIASMILGIISVISLVLCCIPFFCFIPLMCGIPGLILGIIGMKNCTKRGYAVAGIVMSAVSIALAVIALVFVIIFSATGVFDEMIKELEYTMYI